jgi:hypothetical protein
LNDVQIMLSSLCEHRSIKENQMFGKMRRVLQRVVRPSVAEVRGTRVLAGMGARLQAAQAALRATSTAMDNVVSQERRALLRLEAAMQRVIAGQADPLDLVRLRADADALAWQVASQQCAFAEVAAAVTAQREGLIAARALRPEHLGHLRLAVAG